MAEVVFPAPVTRPAPLYALTFRTRVFLGNTRFGVELEHPGLPGRVQEATAGEASALSQSQSLAVFTDVAQVPLLGGMQLSSPVCTPNGDGVNDEVTLALTVYVVEGDKEVWAVVHDLAGRPVRRLRERTVRPSGTQELVWDGRDEGGSVVPPGAYLVRAGFATDARRPHTERVRVVHVAY
ncbi:MAG: FlgD immunoglobulin-like domain containing protein [Candidatus Latescibacterota bacterium]